MELHTINLNDPKELTLIRRKIYDRTRTEVGGVATKRFSGFHMVQVRVGTTPHGAYLQLPTVDMFLPRLEPELAATDDFVTRQEVIDCTLLEGEPLTFDNVVERLQAWPEELNVS